MPLPLPALYFIRPTPANIDFLLADYEEGDPIKTTKGKTVLLRTKKCLYKRAYVAFSSVRTVERIFTELTI